MLASRFLKTFIRSFRRFACGGLCVLALASLFFAYQSVAAESSARVAVATRAGVHDKFERIVFDWPSNVSYSVARKGGRVTVTFSAGGNVNLKPLASAKLSKVKDFSVDKNSDDQLVVSFTVDEKYLVKDFTSGKAVAFDVVAVGEAKTPAAAPQVASAKEQPKELSQEVIKKEPPQEAVKETKAVEKPAVENKLVPDKNLPIAKIEGNTIVVTPPVSPEEKFKASPVKEVKRETLPEMKVVETPTVTVGEAQDSQRIQRVVQFKVLNQPPKLEIGTSPELILSLNPKAEVGAAVFMRGGYGYIIFDRKLNTELDNITAGQIVPRVRLELLDLPNNAGYRFSVPRGVELRANREGTVWQLFLSKQWRDNPVSSSLSAQPDFALGARLLLSAIDPPEPVSFTDPVIGDDIIVLPLRQLDAVSVPLRFAELETIPCAQGMVLKPLIDKLSVHKTSDGVEITAAKGLSLSPASDVGLFERSTTGKSRPATTGKVFFDFASWAGKKNETYIESRQRLMQTIVDVKESERNRARLDLAKFYFAHGFGSEALSLLKFLSQEDPDLKNYSDFIALLGAAKVLSGYPEDGLNDLNNPDLKFHPEIKLWQAIALVQLRDWQGAEEKFAITHSIFSSYPEPFYSKVYLLAIEAAIALGKEREAAEWLMQIDMQPHSHDVDTALDYLRGVLHSKAGRQVMAEDLWKKVARSSNRLYQIRAKLALIDLGVATKSLSSAQAAEQLETMRFMWRGDELELDILHRLGLFYLDAKNMKGALSTLAQAIRLFPNSTLTPQIKLEMAEAFRSIFAEGASPVSPIEALSLYQTFSDLVPPGIARNTIVLNIVERLVSIDLLEQASSLLEGVIKDALQGEEKARASTRLAAIRLLDHKADTALAALDLVSEEGIAPALVEERKILRARALSEQGKSGEALALLGNNDSKPAKVLRADINMRAQRWAEAAKALLDLIGQPPKAGEQITSEQAQWLVNCAVALALAGDVAGLDRIAIDYTPAMVGQPQNDTFRILTRPDKVGQLRDIASAQSKITEVDMFRGFLNNYRSAPDKKN